MKTLPRIGFASLAVAAVAATGLLAAPAPSALAHGYVGGDTSSLISRAAWTANTDRGDVAYEPQSLEAPKGFPAGGPADGRLASAGGLFGETLDEQSATRWAKNVVQAGPVQVSWTLTAAHRTAQWRYFITTQGWDVDAPLDRGDLELLATFDGGGGIPGVPTTHTLTIPSDRTGYHVIYAVWDIADTANAFYNTIDIDVRGGGPSITPPTTPPTPPVVPPATPSAPGAPTGLHAMGRTASSVDLMWEGVQGATSYRVERSTDGVAFTSVGTATQPRHLDTGLAASTTYRYRIVAVSAAGETTGSVLTVTTNAAPTTTPTTAPPTSPPTPTTPPTPPVAPPVEGVAVWSPTGVYTRGDLRQHDGVVYRAVQTHRSWGDPSWITALSLWQPVTHSH
ncbi:lytic polysaccharide monooxygenase [Microbacterium sp. 1.5R]|uniref:lytic polysaccharide monooxygenase n=1 Tax=Microbacterium sp. 1.5R TaxID=1916917 RepID=UPI0011A7DD51|nr:lytic polysaccharide monooxygenase [Microbacterium sp. 1.5R]